jgi:2-dehydro-3-deoxyphosphogluconate aldolase / (4S)-4-hydroxy-2-oxoglutarate aldolase
MTAWTPASRAAAVDAILRLAPVLPVLDITQLDDAVPLAVALAEGGLPVLEVTLRSDAALAAISRDSSGDAGGDRGRGYRADARRP